jgi:hypothetical protein
MAARKRSLATSAFACTHREIRSVKVNGLRYHHLRDFKKARELSAQKVRAQGGCIIITPPSGEPHEVADNTQ